MKRSAWRLAVAAILFAGWIGYLAFLAATTTEPTVLSRSQFLSADLYVAAELSAQRVRSADVVTAQAGGPMAAAVGDNVPAPTDRPDETVVVRKVYWAANPADAERKTLRVKNLPKCGKSLGWQGPGLLGLPSVGLDSNPIAAALAAAKIPQVSARQVTATARYILHQFPEATNVPKGGFWRYAYNPTTLRQLELLTKEYHP